MILPVLYAPVFSPLRLKLNCAFATGTATISGRAVRAILAFAFRVAADADANPENDRYKHPCAELLNEYELAAKLTCSCCGPSVIPL